MKGREEEEEEEKRDETEREREREIVDPLVHSPNAHNRQGFLKSRAWT